MVLTHPIIPTPLGAPLPVLLIASLAYLAPSVAAIIASRQRSGAVLAINLLMGWTLIGWAVSLAMALDGIPPTTRRQDGNVHAPDAEPLTAPGRRLSDAAPRRWP